MELLHRPLPARPRAGPHRRSARTPRSRARRVVETSEAASRASSPAGCPGQDPVVYPEHSGILLQPGDALVFQIHYHYDTDADARPFHGGAPARTRHGEHQEARVVNPIGPVEIPCMPGVVAALCDRNDALKDNARLYGPAGSFIEPGLLGLCGKTAGGARGHVQGRRRDSSCDTKVPMSGTIIGDLGHMHTLGKTFRLTLDPDSPKPTVLLDIPVWNFDWQMNYELKTPIHVEAGQTVRMECSWDRSLDPNRPPKYIVFAEGTEDEMCFGTYALIPDDQSAVG